MGWGGRGGGLLCIEVSRQTNVPIDNLIRLVSLEGFCMWRKGLQLTASYHQEAKPGGGGTEERAPLNIQVEETVQAAHMLNV